MTGAETVHDRATSTFRRRGVSVALSVGLVAAWLTSNAAPAGASAPVITSMSAGAFHTCAVTSAGAAECWGRNRRGQLGDGTTTKSSNPVQVSGLTSGVSAVAAGQEDTCALTTAGGVKCWGYNAMGQLGDGTTNSSLTPVQVAGLTSGVSAIAASANWQDTCALTTAGGVKCWGSNGDGQLGNGTNTNSPTPVQVSGLTSGVSAISVGLEDACALTTAGAVKCWGSNNNGELGDGTTISRWTPVQVSGLSSVSAISAGTGSNCALTNAGAAKCWGLGLEGQLGDGNTTSSSTPVQVSGLTSGVSEVSTGDAYACVLLTTGAAKCWGSNGNGQRGDGTTTAQLTPVQVYGLTSGVSEILAGVFHTCASMSGGGMNCWGLNSFGQLGDGTRIDSPVPVEVFGPVITGVNHSLSGVSAVTSSGKIPVTTTWNGMDRYGTITSYQAQEQINGGIWRDVALSSPTATSLTVNLISDNTYNFRIRATDSLGNMSGFSPGAAFILRGYQEGSASYNGAWVSRSLAGYWGGTVNSSTDLDAFVSFTFTGLNLALVGTKGPAYGAFNVFVDDMPWKTIDCHAGSTLKRQILFRYATGSSVNTTHTVSISNLATAGHPRVDIDGFVSFQAP